MRDVHGYFQSTYLRASDLRGKQWTVEIDRVEEEEIGRGSNKSVKPVVYFKGGRKGLALNQTNARAIERIARTPDLDQWHGVKITLYVDDTITFGADIVSGIRIQDPHPPPAAKAGEEETPF